MIKTYGLTHVAVAVKDVDRAFTFYERVFGMKVVYRDRNFLQAQTPGTRDVLVFERKAADAGKEGGVAHFGFRLQDPDDIEKAAREVEAAGGKIRSRGEFVPGEPYVFAEDLDGYEVEIWYEIPTTIDPR